MEDSWQKAHALGEVFPSLSELFKEEALEAARAIRDPESRAQALSYIAPNLPPVAHESILSEALEAVRHIEHGRPNVLEDLLSVLPDTLIGAAVNVAQEFRHPSSRAAALKGGSASCSTRFANGTPLRDA